jgi:hypothetical protein
VWLRNYFCDIDIFAAWILAVVFVIVLCPWNCLRDCVGTGFDFIPVCVYVNGTWDLSSPESLYLSRDLLLHVVRGVWLNF